MTVEANNLELYYEDLAEIDKIAKKIIKFAKDLKIWTLEGPLGAGKTTLAQALAREMNVLDRVQSPTFSLVNEYLCEDQSLIYHFDFYRIKDENEALDLGYEEYFYSGKYCWIEWASRIPELIPSKHLKIEIQIDETKRRLALSRYE